MSSAPTPFGPPSLWAVTEQRSAPSAAKSTATWPAAAQASTWTRTSRARAAATTAAAGCSVPTSWLASWTETSAVSGRMAAATSSGSKRPSRSTPTTVSSAGSRRHASSTRECSTAVVTTCRRGRPARTAPQIAVLTASVPLAVNTTSRGRAPKQRRDLLARVLDRDPGDAALGVQPAGVAVVLARGTGASRRARPGAAARTTRDRGRRAPRRVVSDAGDAVVVAVGAARLEAAAACRRRGRRASRGSSRGRPRTRRAGTAARPRRTGSAPTRS